MSKFLRYLSRAAAVALALFVPVVAQAQAEKPVLVISINKMNELMGDIGMLTELAGQADAGKLIVGMAGIYSNGIDRTKPAGAYVTMSETGPRVIAFIPVTNLKGLLATFREQIGTPKDVGNGVFEIGADRAQSLFVKEQSGWAFVSQDSKQLAGLPDNPVALLGGLDKQYDLAVRVNVANVPAEMRDLLVSQMRVGFDQSMRQQNRNLGEDERKAAEAVGRGLMEGIVDFVEQAEQMTFGIAADAKTKSFFLESTTTAKPGTELAKQMAGFNTIASNFGGVIAGDPAASVKVSMPLSKSDIDGFTQLIEVARKSGLKAIDDDAGIPDQRTREAIKEASNGLLDLFVATAKKGKIDAAGALRVHDEGLELAAGTFVADGVKLEQIVKKIAALAKNEPNFPDIQFDFASYGGVSFHKIQVPVDDRNARKVFGDDLQIVLGFGKEAAYIAVGDDALTILKKAIDKSTSASDPQSPPVIAKVNLAPIFKFAADVDGNPQAKMLAEAASKSAAQAHLTMTVRPIERGTASRFELGSGVFQIIGEAVKAAQGGR